MTCAWDEAKSRSNFVKHGLDFADAEQVLTGPCVTFVDSSMRKANRREQNIYQKRLGEN
ncbi:MAG: BrnT family toxin [Bryobacteraceae bacterium]